MTKKEFLFHYGCEWDTNEFLGWDEVWICIEQIYEGLEADNKRLKSALKRLTSGEAFYVPMVIPDEIRPELIARSRFIELVLNGEEPNKAAKQAGREEAEKVEQVLKEKHENKN